MRQQRVDHVIHRLAGLDHQHHAARALEHLDELGNRAAARDLGALRLHGEEIVDLGNGAVEHGDAIAVIVHVEDEVLAHHGQTDQSNVTTGGVHKFYGSGCSSPN